GRNVVPAEGLVRVARAILERSGRVRALALRTHRHHRRVGRRVLGRDPDAAGRVRCRGVRSRRVVFVSVPVPGDSMNTRYPLSTRIIVIVVVAVAVAAFVAAGMTAETSNEDSVSVSGAPGQAVSRDGVQALLPP